VVKLGVGRSGRVSPATAALRLVGFMPMKFDGRVTAMAETKRMTAEQVVSFLLEEEGVDFLCESLRWVVQQLMRRRCRS
jgi:hypothetical protein